MENFNKANLQPSLTEPLKEQSPNDLVANASVTPNEYGGIYDKTKKPQISFLQSRLNKDNFWNLMFFVGTTLFMLLPNIFVDFVPISGLITLVIGITFIPYKIARMNPVTYKEDTFFSNNGRNLSKNLPKFAAWVLILSFVFTIFSVLKIHDNWSFLDENFAIYNAIFWFSPTVYCILKNLPIAVYFKNETYIGDEAARSFSSTEGRRGRHHTDNSILSVSSMQTSPMNSWYSGNIYHRDR